MIRNALYNMYMLSIFFSGILIGGLYTHDFFAQQNAAENENDIEKVTPQPIKKKPSAGIRTV